MTNLYPVHIPLYTCNWCQPMDAQNIRSALLYRIKFTSFLKTPYARTIINHWSNTSIKQYSISRITHIGISIVFLFTDPKDSAQSNRLLPSINFICLLICLRVPKCITLDFSQLTGSFQVLHQLRLQRLELTLQALSPVLARYDPFGVDVPLNCDTTTTTHREHQAVFEVCQDILQRVQRYLHNIGNTVSLSLPILIPIFRLLSFFTKSLIYIRNIVYSNRYRSLVQICEIIASCGASSMFLST